MLHKVLVLLLIVFLAGCSDDQQVSQSTPSPKGTAQDQVAPSSLAATPHTAEQSLLFFLDPNGRPCQMQDRILLEMAAELKGKVIIKYVKTTIPSDRTSFYQYGIRALPTLLLADSTGNEIKRMTPGVKSAAEIRTLLQSQPRS